MTPVVSTSVCVLRNVSSISARVRRRDQDRNWDQHRLHGVSSSSATRRARSAITRMSSSSSSSDSPRSWFPTTTAVAAAVLAGSVALSSMVGPAHARLDPVDRPDLLPKEFTTIIDVAGFLTPGEEKRLAQIIDGIERDCGFKVRLLAQNYPVTPGLAIKDYWGVDANTVVLVADPNFGGILNFNVGQNIDLEVPRNFWSKVSGKYGNKFYWQDAGEKAAIENAIVSIDNCFREPQGRDKCRSVIGAYDLPQPKNKK